MNIVDRAIGVFRRKGVAGVARRVASRLRELSPLREENVFYDARNYFSFIDTFNERTRLAQRGANKQKRRDLRQLYCPIPPPPP